MGIATLSRHMRWVKGCIQIDLDNLGEQDTPKLLTVNNNPENFYIVEDTYNNKQILQETLVTSTVVKEQVQPSINSRHGWLEQEII